MNYLKRRKLLKSINTMDLVPIRIQGNDIQDGKVVVKVPKFESKIIHMFAPSTAKLFFNINLDKLGSATWQSIDGARNVQQICDFIRMSWEEEKEPEELEERLSKYIMLLYERKFISFQQLLNN